MERFGIGTQPLLWMLPQRTHLVGLRIFPTCLGCANPWTRSLFLYSGQNVIFVVVRFLLDIIFCMEMCFRIERSASWENFVSLMFSFLYFAYYMCEVGFLFYDKSMLKNCFIITCKIVLLEAYKKNLTVHSLY